MHHFQSRFLAAILLAVTTFTTLAALSGQNDIAIGGYSPVSYFSAGKAEQGSPSFSVFHDGKIYFLTSAVQMQRFRDNPEKYIPALAAHCPYSLALGRSVAVDPQQFEIIDGRLYLFHNSTELDALAAWHTAADKEKLLKDAEHQFQLLRF